MQKRQDNESEMHRKIKDLERELERMRYQPSSMTTQPVPLPIVQPLPLTTGQQTNRGPPVHQPIRDPPSQQMGRITTPVENYLVQSHRTVRLNCFLF